MLTGRLKSSGGAVLFEQSEPFLTARAVESVAPGQPYPKSDIPTGTAGLAAVSKWGQGTDLTDEEIDRNVYGGQIVDRKLKKVVNSVIAQVDAVTMSAIASQVTQTQAVGSGLGRVGHGGDPAGRAEGQDEDHQPEARVQPGHAADDRRPVGHVHVRPGDHQRAAPGDDRQPGLHRHDRRVRRTW